MPVSEQPSTSHDRPAGHAEGLVRVRGAHLHNLTGVDLDVPRDALVAFTGISGSGKSSLAFGTIHGEAQRRYFESVAPFARRLIGRATDPQVEDVSGLPPTVALEQTRTAGQARSTVGTVTAVSNSLRLLFSRAGDYPQEVREAHGGRLDSDAFSPNTPQGMCPRCQGLGRVHEPTEDSLVPDASLSIAQGAIAAWPGAWLGKNFRDILATLGYDIHAPWQELPAAQREWILFTDETPVVTVDPVREAGKLQRTYQGKWQSVASYVMKTFTETESDKQRRRALSFLTSHRCPACDGRKLNPAALSVTYLGEPIDVLAGLPISVLTQRLSTRLAALPQTARTPAAEAEHLLLPQVSGILESVAALGLGHLSLGRSTTSVSAGELQRLRLAAQLRSGLYGVVYVLDEPSAGLHPADTAAVAGVVRRLVAEGNTVYLVEHDMGLVAGSDWVVDIGPGAGTRGGRVLYSGEPAGLAGVADSVTARYLGAGPPELRRTPRQAVGRLELRGVTCHNLHGLDVDIPLGTFTVVSGVSGSGKSSLVSHALAEVLRARVRTVDLARTEDSGEADSTEETREVSVGEVTGAEAVDRLVQITQQPIGRTPRSTLATYTGLFDRVRTLFAATAEARGRGWTVSRFSYNMPQGRCATCGGEGQIEVELVFLPGSYTPCPDCRGARYNPETLEVTWEGYTIAEILGLTVEEAVEVFAGDARVSRALRALAAIGLGYLRLGQPAPELSGGEAQRIKLATELQRSPRGHTVYLLDEPTSGLHPADIDLLVAELNRLVDAGNTVITVEHDLRVMAQADHLIDMGPGAGEDGGRIVASGTPAEVAASADSLTGSYLRR